VAAQFDNAANLYGGDFAGSFKAVQDYQGRLLQFFQANAIHPMYLMLDCSASGLEALREGHRDHKGWKPT